VPSDRQGGGGQQELASPVLVNLVAEQQALAALSRDGQQRLGQ